MAVTNDQYSHFRSLPIEPNSKPMLNGQRWQQRSNFYANQEFAIPASNWNSVKDKPKSSDFISIIEYYIEQHRTFNLPRIITLQRYYVGDNDIHYWASEKLNRADNRIANGLAKYFTDFNVGLFLGNPLKYGYENKNDDTDDGSDIVDLVTNFNNENNEPSKDKRLGKDLFNTGRAYDMVYVEQGKNDVRFAPIDPNTCFVVWSTDVEPVELFAVRYYLVDICGVQHFNVEVYTDSNIYYFDSGEAPEQSLQLTSQQDHFFGDVPITEYKLNDEMTGLWESSLDDLDAYDKAMSEMANSQEDFSNSTLVIAGDATVPDKYKQLKDANGHLLYLDKNRPSEFTTVQHNDDGTDNNPAMIANKVRTDGNVMFLRPYKEMKASGDVVLSQPTASYLTKQINATDWQTYLNQILHDLHVYTLTPDITDDQFAGNQTGEAIKMKLAGSLTAFVTFKDNFFNAITRRITLASAYWIKNNELNASDDNNLPKFVTFDFKPNLPSDDANLMAIINTLKASGVISNETIQELASQLTGIPADTEQERMSDQQDESDQRNAEMMNKMSQLNQNNNSPSVPDDDSQSDDGAADSDTATESQINSQEKDDE